MNDNDRNRNLRYTERQGTGMLPRRTRTRALALVLVGAAIAACDLVVDPSNDVPPDVATETISGVGSLVTSVYARLQDVALYGNELIMLGDLMADNATTSQPAVNRQGEFANSVGQHMGDWGESYAAINEANFAIASARNLTDAEPTLANRYLGEALFQRGLLYFDLARVFGYEPGQEVDGWTASVVLRTEPTRSADDATFLPRATNVEVYTQIEQDLLEAIDLLEQHGLDDPYRGNQAAAEALLAKVYLYWSRWDDAIEYATAAMSHTDARLAEASEVATMFTRAPNVESLFEINYDAATETLWVNDCSACYTWPHGTWFSMWPSAELLALFDAGDARTALYPACPVGCPTTAQSGIRYVNKYTYARGDWTDNSPVLRFADVLLMRAEAYAESGQTAQAQADLNALRAKRGVDPITASGAALEAAIQAERRRELAFEGHRWFDLKRRGMDITKPSLFANPTVPYSDFRLLAPLPNDQVTNNPMLEQNPGY
jgi:starch-binding outer membrane protein, SusD/RagB family